MNPPSGRATTVARPQTGTPPSIRPSVPIGRPDRSKTCQASEPPFCQPVPSVQTRMVSPRALPATAGCLRSPRPPGGAIGGEASCDLRIDPAEVDLALGLPGRQDAGARLGQRGAAHRADVRPARDGSTSPRKWPARSSEVSRTCRARRPSVAAR